MADVDEYGDAPVYGAHTGPTNVARWQGQPLPLRPVRRWTVSEPEGPARPRPALEPAASYRNRGDA